MTWFENSQISPPAADLEHEEPLARPTWHQEAGHHDVDPAHGDDGLLRRADRRHHGAGMCQDRLEDIQRGCVVVDDQNADVSKRAEGQSPSIGAQRRERA